MDEVGPAVFDLQVTLGLLGFCLMHELQGAAIVELPNDGVLGELAVIGQGRAGTVLAHAGGIDDDGTFGQVFDDLVVPLSLGAEVIAHGNAAAFQQVDGLGQARNGTIVHVDAGGHVVAVLFMGQVCADCQGAAAGAQNAGFCLGIVLPVVCGHEGIEGQANTDGILCMAAQLLAILGDGGNLAELQCIGIEILEQILAGVVQVDLMGGYQSAHAQGIVLDELNGCAIVLSGSMQADIDALDAGVNAQSFCPDGEDLHDGRLAGGNTDEVHSGLGCSRRQINHGIFLLKSIRCRVGYSNMRTGFFTVIVLMDS